MGRAELEFATLSALVRVRGPTSTITPSASWRITTRLASHASRWDVSAETRAPPSRTDWPGRFGIRQHLGIHVDDYLIALARGARIDPVVQRRLREQRQGVGLLLLERARFRGNVLPPRP